MNRVLKQTDYVASQTAATINFKTGWLGRLLCSGLEFQIEHHLFPGMPYANLPRASVIVKRFCEEEGLWYRVYGWDAAIWKSLETVRRPTIVQSDPACMRRPVEAHQPAEPLSDDDDTLVSVQTSAAMTG